MAQVDPGLQGKVRGLRCTQAGLAAEAVAACLHSCLAGRGGQDLEAVVAELPAFAECGCGQIGLLPEQHFTILHVPCCNQAAALACYLCVDRWDSGQGGALLCAPGSGAK
jgi:hypothetical protein